MASESLGNVEVTSSILVSSFFISCREMKAGAIGAPVFFQSMECMVLRLNC